MGIDRDTPRRFYAHLIRMNRERTIPFSPLDVWTKFLSQITFPKLLADEAIKQLQNPTVLLAGGPYAGQPDLGALIPAFEEMWHTIYDRGIEIKPQAAPVSSSSTGPSNRVDGMMLLAENNESGPLCTMQAYAGETQPRFDNDSSAFLRVERYCWRCKGWGHEQSACPSPVRQRSLAACIKGLQDAQSSQNERLRSMQRRRVTVNFRKKGGTSSANSVELDELEPITAYLNEDGSIVSESGDILRNANECTEQHDGNLNNGGPDHSESNVATTVESNAVTTSLSPISAVQAPTPHDSAATAGAVSSAVQGNVSGIDSAIEADFASTIMSSFSADAPTDDFEFTVPVRSHGRSAIRVGMLMLATLTIGLAGMRATRGKAFGVLVGLVTSAAGAIPCMPDHALTRVHSSRFVREGSYQFARSSAYDVGTEKNSQLSGVREHGIVDSGTTANTSGRAKLFPESMTEEWHPNIKVEVASGVCLSVERSGVMLIKVWKENQTSTKKAIKLPLKHSLLVPGMPVTLISTKSIFKHEGIRTYFNDELRLILPNGDIVRFVETRRNYTLAFCDDTTPIVAVACHAFTRANPLPLDWSLAHARLVHFSPERILASENFVSNFLCYQ